MRGGRQEGREEGVSTIPLGRGVGGGGAGQLHVLFSEHSSNFLGRRDVCEKDTAVGEKDTSNQSDFNLG